MSATGVLGGKSLQRFQLAGAHNAASAPAYFHRGCETPKCGWVRAELEFAGGNEAGEQDGGGDAADLDDRWRGEIARLGD